MRIEPGLSAAAGVRIAGLDLRHRLTSEAREAVTAALLRHQVAVFPGQSLTREQQYAFAAQFGEVEIHGGHRGETKRREVAHVMSNLDAEGRPTVRRSPAANYHWHTDKPYHRAPPAFTLLYAVEVPPPTLSDRGGDTEFANTALAYDALPDATRRQIAALRVEFRPAFDERRPAVDHPLVRTHPETGRKALYLGNHATHIRGMPEADGKALLAELLAHAIQPRFVYAHRWQLGDLVMWEMAVYCTGSSPIKR